MVGIERYLDSTVPLRITFISGIPDPTCTKKRTHFVWCSKGKLFPKLLPFAILPFPLLSKPLVECDCAHLLHAETRCAWIQQRTSQAQVERWAKPDTPETHFWAVQKARFELKKKKSRHTLVWKAESCSGQSQKWANPRGRGSCHIICLWTRIFCSRWVYFLFSQTDYGFLPVQHWIRLYTSPKSTMNLVLVCTGVSGHATTTCPLEAKLQSNLTQSLTQERD